jgi:hypothetical protein
VKSATVFGVATRLGNPVAIRSAAGRTLDAYAVDDYDLELEGAEIDLDHEGEPVGQIVYAEIDNDQLAVVGVVDGALAEVAEERDVFFSGSYARHGDYGLRERSSVVPQAKVLGMSLTLRPANSSAQVVRWMPGDVRDSLDRRGWPISWSHSHPLLARAVNNLGTDWQVRTRSASRIVDRRDQDDGYPGFREGQYVQPRNFHSRELPNGLRKSAHRGRILSVR